MFCCFINRLHCTASNFRGISKAYQCLYPLRRQISSSGSVYNFSNIHLEDKYEEIRSRLAEIPLFKMLDREVGRIQHELCYEKDERLVDVLKWYLKVFICNTKNSRFFRADVILKAYCTYGFAIDDASWNQWDSDGWRSAVILAWCTELFHSYIVIIDDIIDQSTLRREEPCWYTRPDTGLSAINDALLLQCGVYKLLQNHFAGSKCYMNILKEFLQANNEIVYGQRLDTLIQINKKSGFSMLTSKKYQALTDYKTGNYSYRLPIHLAMHLAEGYSAEDFDAAKRICLKLGLYFQSQDDLLDCYGPIEHTGMIGNDIREGRITWLALKFFEEAPDSLKKHFLKNYGVDDKDAIAEVLELYRKTNLLEKFQEFENHLYTEISTLIESTYEIKGAFFYDLFHQVRNRTRKLVGLQQN